MLTTDQMVVEEIARRNEEIEANARAKVRSILSGLRAQQEILEGAQNTIATLKQALKELSYTPVNAQSFGL